MELSFLPGGGRLFVGGPEFFGVKEGETKIFFFKSSPKIFAGGKGRTRIFLCKQSLVPEFFHAFKGLGGTRPALLPSKNDTSLTFH